MAYSAATTQRDLSTKLTVLMLWLLLGVFVIYPFLRLLGVAFFVDGSFTLDNLKPFLGSWYDQRAAVNSILLGCSVGLTGTILGFIFAYAVTRLGLPTWLKLAVSAVTLLPLISPPFTSSIALTLSLGPNGILLDFLGIDDFNFYGFWGTYISESLTYFPVAFMTLSTILSRIDPNLEDAAYSLGASSLRVFRTVTLPLAAPGIAHAFLLVFSCSLADFATPQVLGGHSIPVLP
ncbi:MAG: ABC transporter permease subunit, partial [Mesosutterella sp.]|nr:ABC transporter permease subunit [Mesosutterella sp.]